MVRRHSEPCAWKGGGGETSRFLWRCGPQLKLSMVFFVQNMLLNHVLSWKWFFNRTFEISWIDNSFK